MAKKKVPAKKSKKDKLKTYSVGVNVSVSGHITVQARDREHATELARNVFSRQWKDNSHHGLECPCVDVDYAEGDDVEEESEDT
jgi:hypothetical protein